MNFTPKFHSGATGAVVQRGEKIENDNKKGNKYYHYIKILTLYDQLLQIESSKISPLYTPATLAPLSISEPKNSTQKSKDQFVCY